MRNDGFPNVSILDVIHQPLFRQWFKDPATWQAWFGFLAALFALPMSPAQLASYRRCTGRSALPTSGHTGESWLNQQADDQAKEFNHGACCRFSCGLSRLEAISRTR